MLRVLLASLLVISAVPASAQNYPTRPVTLVVPFGAGSGTDVMARTLADELGKKLGQAVVVENRPGGSSIPAAEFVARAAPDGYTLFMGGNTTHSANPHLFKELRYDPLKDFTPISRLATAGAVLVVSPKSEFNSIADVVKAAKADPGKLTYGASNSGSQIAAERIKRVGGVDITRVPYKTTPQALSDVIAGHLSMTFLDVAAALSAVKNGQVRALAISSGTRSQLLPDVPTMQEVGFPGFDLTFWNGLFGPAKMPADIATKLSDAAAEIMKSDQMKQRLTAVGLDAAPLPAAQMDGYMRAELDKWGSYVRESGIQPN
ncbi:tripartite tricarboxylate transporter substrate binding protein [Pseudorhodoplanes sp.]|uniref:Bug family tripartite tricarboxylate transporter substrate binding protein n=1 Tax=Pseudorhodoplanes sp. TaxID=1934341 RepID=UPI002BF84601|nr:tripartite tricarboxylate transporter substrate binding protein [Pseudorhodoplanes sp.]HWV54887.1 tripartite tricarboxylate transporter substrate binding protein [Pseudorhodoplanes sp.]